MYDTYREVEALRIGERMRKSKAIIRATRSGYNFTLIASNGKVVAHSNQGYVKKSEAIRILRKYFPYFEIQDV